MRLREEDLAWGAALLRNPRIAVVVEGRMGQLSSQQTESVIVYAIMLACLHPCMTEMWHTKQAGCVDKRAVARECVELELGSSQHHTKC